MSISEISSQPTLTPHQTMTMAKIVIKLAELGVEVRPTTHVSVGPILTVYRVIPKGTTKATQVESSATDLAMFLGVEDIVIKRLPGESSMSIFIPNEERTFVKFQDCITGYYQSDFKQTIFPHIPLIMGVDYLGKFVTDDLSTLPHLLIAGTTGGGKSTLLASLVAGMVYIKSPFDLHLYIADSKGVEFTNFEGCPHIKARSVPIYAILEQMEHLIEETEHRLKLFSRYNGIKNIKEFNELQINLSESQTKLKNVALPYICFVIDELADLLDNKTKMEGAEDGKTGRSPAIGKIASDYLGKIVQKSRASGIHVIAATQRPSVNIIQGSIKANFPARLTFRLPSRHDSQTVINTEGAEHLLSRGDMLYISPNKPGIQRLHAPYASNIEIQAAIEMAKYKE